MTDTPHTHEHTTGGWHEAVKRSYSAPVMRQTQALIGLVVLAGTAAYFLSPLWLILPAIAGLGLLAAGLTGVCPMAIAVGKLPWNRSAAPETSASCCTR